MTDGRGEAGEGACYAHLICPECGTVLDGAGHRNGCTWMDPDGGVAMDNLEPGPKI